MFLDGNDPAEYQGTLRAQLSLLHEVATWLSRLAVTRAGRNSAFVAFSLFPNAMQWIARVNANPSIVASSW